MRKNSTPARRLWLMVASFAMMLLFAGLPQAAFAQSAPPAPPADTLIATINEDATTTLITTFGFDARYKVDILSGPTPHGTITGIVDSGGKFAIVYKAGDNQTATPVTFSYRFCERMLPPGDTNACRPTNVGASATATITIVPVNDNPVANADTAMVTFTSPVTPVTIDVKTNDNPGPNEAPPVDNINLESIVTNPTKGTVTISNQQIVYTPNATVCNNVAPNTEVQDVFTYRIRDNGGLTAIGQVTVKIMCPGPPTLKLSAPEKLGNQIFKVNVVLDSPTIPVGAVDFRLALEGCLLDPDVPTNNGFAGDGNPGNPSGLDDVTPLLPANFTFDARDLAATLTTAITGTNYVRMIASNPLAQGAVLAGPSQASRPIASIMLRSNPICAGSMISTTIGFTQTIFTNASGQPIPNGTSQSRDIDLAKEVNNQPAALELIDLNPEQPDTDSEQYYYIGTFKALDPDEGETFTYTILEQLPPPTVTFGLGEPSDPNDNDELVLSLPITAPRASGIYTLTVRAMGNFGSVITDTFNVEILAVNRAPVANPDPSIGASIPVTTMTTITNVLANDSDPDGGTLTIQSVTNGSNGNVETDGKNVTYILTNINFAGTDVFTYTISDNDLLDPKTAIATVTVSVPVNSQVTGFPLGRPGDCNMSNSVEAGDLTALGLEIFDGDGSLWYNAFGGTFKNFSPYGCDANKDGQINAGDITCTVRLIFGQTCTTVAAAGSVNATLAVADSVNATRGGTVSVPVALSSAGNAVSGAAFVVNFDADKFDFDSVEVQANADMLDEVNATAGRVEIALGNTAAFADGTIVMVNLTVKADAADGSSAISLSESSLGSVEGAEVAVEAVDGTVVIGEVVFSDFIYLPFIGR